ncbi:MAG TPA: hypothetical protein VKK61_09550 [Tepidisphaeraceae bacterium]|nr:hypothetical protein [Tepidisphaeraceae bacterium]
MGVYEGRGSLAKAMIQLDNRWIDAKISWEDLRSQEFEERFLVPLRSDLRSAVSAMDQMATLLTRIRGECR